jgi:glycerol-3-phosphate dehydrogenase
MKNKPLHIAVIGGGGTGAALAHDLTLRGFRVTLLEKGALISGTTGRHHGQLHSGARYVFHDRTVARECIRENKILRRIAPQAIEFNFGLFIALTPEEEAYCTSFLAGCEEAGIRTRLLSAREALELEPNLNPSLRLAVQVPDGTMDAFRLPLHFFAMARQGGAVVKTFSEVVGIELEGSAVRGLRVRDYGTAAEYTLAADAVVNAAGVWAGKVASLAGLKVSVSPSPGTMAAVKGRIVNMVISRLRPPGDGDAVVPQRNLSIIGTTETLSENPDFPGEVKKEDVDKLLACADELIPGFSRAPFHAAWSAARPLTGTDGGGIGRARATSPREMSRDYTIHDHAARDGVQCMLTITGGKATVLRAMAEAAADRLCEMLGVPATCSTASTPLIHYRRFFKAGRIED